MSARLEIAQWRASYLVPPQERDPAGVRVRLDRIIIDEVAPALRSCLERAISDTDEAVWLIRRLDLDVLVSLEGLDATALPDRFANAVATRILNILGKAPRGADVLRFANRAAFLAYFLRDLVSGRAWDCWQYQEFAGLRPLTAGAAIRETFLREPDLASAVWQELRIKGWMEMVMAVASDRDVEVIARLLCPPPKKAIPRGAIECLAHALANAGLERQGGQWRTPRNVLRVLVSIKASAEGVTLPFAIVDDVFALADLIADEPLSELETAFGTASTRGEKNRKRASDTAVRRRVEELMTLFGADPKTVETLVMSLVAQVAPSQGAPGFARSIATRFASAFLLVPSLERLGFDRVSPQFRYQLLGRCLAPSFRRAESRDDVLALAAGLPEDAPLALPDQAAEVRWVWLTRLLELGRWDGEHLGTERLIVRGSSLVLLRSSAQDVWLTMGSSLRDCLFLLRAASGTQRQSLTRVRLGNAARDCSFLSLAPEAPVEPEAMKDTELEVMLDLATRSVLRDFALRLPGFSGSSLAYLFSEFLEGVGVVEVHRDPLIYEVRLPATPLRMLLRLAGMHRNPAPLPWSPNATLRFTIPE